MLCGQSSGSCYHHLCSELDEYIADDWVTCTMRPHPCWSDYMLAIRIYDNIEDGTRASIEEQRKVSTFPSTW